MVAEHAFQIKVYLIMLVFVAVLTFIWFLFLQKYFELLKNVDEQTYQKLGNPDLKRAIFPKESVLIKHLFSELDANDSKQYPIKNWHDRLRFVFLLYLLLFIMIFSYILLVTFF